MHPQNSAGWGVAIHQYEICRSDNGRMAYDTADGFKATSRRTFSPMKRGGRFATSSCSPIKVEREFDEIVGDDNYEAKTILVIESTPLMAPLPINRQSTKRERNFGVGGVSEPRNNQQRVFIVAK